MKGIPSVGMASGYALRSMAQSMGVCGVREGRRPGPQGFCRPGKGVLLAWAGSPQTPNLRDGELPPLLPESSPADWSDAHAGAEEPAVE